MGTIVVTGSAGGIGSATVAHLSAAGHRVLGVDLRDAEVVADLSTVAGRETMVADITAATGGKVDGVVAAAGVATDRGADAIAVNYFGAVATLAGLRPLLAAAGGGSAVAVASNSMTISAERIEPQALDACLSGDELAARSLVAEGPAGYVTAKSALTRWARRQATSPPWLEANIRLNVVAPGPIATRMAESIADEILARGASFPVPTGRLGTPAEVAAAIGFLLSPHSSFVIGAVLFVDGGGDAAAFPDR